MVNYKFYDGIDWVELLKSSDISSWAKASTKPSYNFSEIGAGNIIQGNADGYYSYRQGSGVRAGFYYHWDGDESVVFCNE